MNLPMLAVDKDIEVSLREQAEWDKQGINTISVDSMQEAIEKLDRYPFLFTAINADTINYLPMLKIMRSISPTPIFIFASHVAINDKIEALRHGVDGYEALQNDSKNNVELALALLEQCNQRNKRLKETSDFKTHRNLFVSLSFMQAFYKDTEIILTKMELELLYLFIERRGHVLSHEQIYKHLCQDINTINIDNAVCCLVGRLRRKLSAEPEMKNYIQTVRNVGYRFILS